MNGNGGAFSGRLPVGGSQAKRTEMGLLGWLGMRAGFWPFGFWLWVSARQALPSFLPRVASADDKGGAQGCSLVVCALFQRLSTHNHRVLLRPVRDSLDCGLSDMPAEVLRGLSQRRAWDQGGLRTARPSTVRSWARAHAPTRFTPAVPIEHPTPLLL